jgi:hypothetical protein
MGSPSQKISADHQDISKIQTAEHNNEQIAHVMTSPCHPYTLGWVPPRRRSLRSFAGSNAGSREQQSAAAYAYDVSNLPLLYELALAI